MSCYSYVIFTAGQTVASYAALVQAWCWMLQMCAFAYAVLHSASMLVTCFTAAAKQHNASRVQTGLVLQSLRLDCRQQADRGALKYS